MALEEANKSWTLTFFLQVVRYRHEQALGQYQQRSAQRPSDTYERSLLTWNIASMEGHPAQVRRERGRRRMREGGRLEGKDCRGTWMAALIDYRGLGTRRMCIISPLQAKLANILAWLLVDLST